MNFELPAQSRILFKAPISNLNFPAIFDHIYDLPNSLEICFECLSDTNLALLPDLILTPSDAENIAWRWHLMDSNQLTSKTDWFGNSRAMGCQRYESQGTCTSHLDWFELHANSSNWKIRLELSHAIPSKRIGIVLSMVCNPEIEKPNPYQTTPPPYPLSQIESGGENGRNLCSPTTIATLLNLRPDQLPNVAQKCLHPPSGLNGVWPQSVWAAHEFDYSGICTWIHSSDDLGKITSQLPMFGASIQCKAGELAGFPIDQGSKGHLLVVYGLCDEFFYVCEPAESLNSLCLKRYPKEEFLTSWGKSKFLTYLMWRFKK